MGKKLKIFHKFTSFTKALIVARLFFFGHAFAGAIPQNSNYSSNSDGWTCNRGYYKAGNECLKVLVPENAEPNYFGDGWFYKKGFYRSKNECLEIKIPENGELGSTEQGWVCKKGFSQFKDQCLEIRIPENGKLNYSGNGWLCEDDFKKVKDHCKAMTASELKKQKELEKYVDAQMAKYRSEFIRSNNGCSTEHKSGAEVCLESFTKELQCHQDIFENHYDSCDVFLKYELTTNYKGSSRLEVDVRCEVEIRYDGKYFYSHSSSDSSSKNYDLYANGNDKHTADFHFSFSAFDEVRSAKLTNSECKIKDVQLR